MRGHHSSEWIVQCVMFVPAEFLHGAHETERIKDVRSFHVNVSQGDRLQRFSQTFNGAEFLKMSKTRKRLQTEWRDMCGKL